MHAEEGDVRVVDEVAVNGFVTGALQVFQGGRYGAVCSTGFDDADAAVACRQLGFPGAAFVLQDPFGVSDSGSKERTAPDMADLSVRPRPPPPACRLCYLCCDHLPTELRAAPRHIFHHDQECFHTATQHTQLSRCLGSQGFVPAGDSPASMARQLGSCVREFTSGGRSGGWAPWTG